MSDLKVRPAKDKSETRHAEARRYVTAKNRSPSKGGQAHTTRKGRERVRDDNFLGRVVARLEPCRDVGM